MKNIFIVVLWILAFSLIVCYMTIRKKKSEVKKLTQVLLLATALTEIVFSVTFFNSRPLVIDLAFGLYLACVDWLLYILMMYTKQYTKVFNEIKYVRFGMMIFCMIDTVSMIANSFLHHSFTLYPVKFLNQSYYVIGEKTPFFIVHVAFVDVWIFAILLGYIFKTMRVASMYKCKYYPVMILTITIIIASAYFEFSSIPVDFSVIVYALAALALCWFSMYVIPQDLVYNAFSFVINDYNDGIMCFDNEDQCIYINDIMSGYICVREEEKELIHQNFQEWKKEHLIADKKYLSWEQIEVIDGERRLFEHNYRKLYDKRGRYIGCYFALKDKSVLLEQLRKEHYRVTHDSLTDIYNEQQFYEVTQDKLEPGKDYFMVCFNIDDFKKYNHICGREKGDEVLRVLSMLLRKNKERLVTYGRLREDKFVFALKRDELDFSYMEKQLERIQQRFGTEDDAPLHIYVGVYPIEDPGEKVESMCRKAEWVSHAENKQDHTMTSYYQED